MSTLRTSESTHRSLKELSNEMGLPMQAVLHQAVAAYRKTVFLEKLNADFAALRSNPEAWEDEQQERVIWEQSLSDGLTRNDAE